MAIETRTGPINIAAAERKECPVCGKPGSEAIYRQESVPVHSVLLFRSREEAVNFPRGDLVLIHCRGCGFVWNAAFDESAMRYSGDCEETQGFSETFNEFQRRLAEGLVERHKLRRKKIIEIGCGKGEFLTLLCELGNNSGVGFDPAYVRERSRSRESRRVRFVRDFYSHQYADVQADFICCKMTLEHVARPAELFRVIRQSIRPGYDPVVFIQIPCFLRILQETAFWDIYYEHCSYFTLASLARLFRLTGFDVLRLERDFGGQYLIAEARMTNGVKPVVAPAEADDDAEAASLLPGFEQRAAESIARWRGYFRAARSAGKRIALWGGGSKAVAFLTATAAGEDVAAVVDINPHKHGTYLPGAGHRIFAPHELREAPPDEVVLMNPVYRDEVRAELEGMGLRPAIRTVTEETEVRA